MTVSLQDSWDTMQALQDATKQTFLRATAYGGLIPLRLPQELQSMVMQNVKDISRQEIKSELHKNDIMYLIITNDDDDRHAFVVGLNKQQAKDAELCLNLLPPTAERTHFGDVLFNFHGRHKAVMYEISQALYIDIISVL